MNAWLSTYGVHISPARKFLQSTLINEVNNNLRGRVLVVNVAQPALDLVRMSQDVLLIWKVTLLLLATEVVPCATHSYLHTANF